MTELNFDEEMQRLESLRKTDLLDSPIDNRFERITRLVQNVLKVPIASFNLIDRDRQWTKSVQGLSVVEIARNESFCSHVIQGERTLVVNDARKDDRFADNPNVTGNPNIVFYAGCPVHAPDGQRIGALCAIDKKPRELSLREIQMLRDMAGVLESELRIDAMQRKLDGLEQKLDAAQRLARVDSLTRLWNREGIIDVMKREWAESIRNETPISVVMADIDHFKKINDEHGHATGDAVLQQLSKILTGTLRTEDAIGRIGGEEFLIVLPGCPADRLQETMDRIRMETMISPIDTESGVLPVTVSFDGISTVATHGMEMTDMMKHADEALYAAKQNGRNRAEVYKGKLSKAA